MDGPLHGAVSGPITALTAAQIVIHLHIRYLSTCLISLKQEWNEQSEKANNSHSRAGLTSLISPLGFFLYV